MRHGLSFLPDSPAADGSGPSATEYFSMLLELSCLADQAGMSHVKITEHYLQPYGGYCPSPLAFLAAVAARTRQIRLMTGCLLPVFHHPIQLASDTAMVDAMSGGRLDVGFARAYMPYEFDAFNISMDSSRDRFVATVSTVQQLWSRTEVSAKTPYFAFTDATTLPRPVQAGGPPVWIAAVRSAESFQAAGANGQGLLVTPSLSPLAEMATLIEVYRDSFVPRFDGDAPRVLASLPLFVGQTDEQARAVADPLLAHYLQVWAASADAWSSRSSSDYRGYTGMGRAIRSFGPQQLRTVGGAVVGSPEHVIDRISTIQDILDVDGFLWQVDFGGVGLPTAQGNVELFLSDVEPALRCFDRPALHGTGVAAVA
jgi:alkanesulfonate monooxygenase SsuD/methylene tetrahydromethanopterin reductase-like flavin-dependent oxidoreductase (luciferase family)